MLVGEGGVGPGGRDGVEDADSGGEFEEGFSVNWMWVVAELVGVGEHGEV